MKCIATYPAYSLANDRQIDLLAAEIDASVQYVPTGLDQVYWGELPIYALCVPAECAEEAAEIIRVLPDEDHKCLYGCPHCSSANVEERSIEDQPLACWWLMAASFTLTGILALLDQRVWGRIYRCRDCGKQYRKKP